jgi:hypothetical protein
MMRAITKADFVSRLHQKLARRAFSQDLMIGGRLKPGSMSALP